MATSSSVFHRHRKKSLAILVLLFVVLADIAGTAALKLFGFEVYAASSATSFRRPHPDYHHDLRTNVAMPGRARWGERRYDMFTNSLGFRDAEPRAVPLLPEQKRVLLIGDSFTEGIGVDYPDTFAGLLATRFASRGVEVLNAGVVTYSPSIYHRKSAHLLEEVGLRFDRVVVCLDVSDIFDEVHDYEWRDGRVVDRPRPVEPRRERGLDDVLKDFVREHTTLLRTLREMLRGARSTDADRLEALEHERSLWTRDATAWADHGREGIARCEEQLGALDELLSRRGIPWTLVVYPWPGQIAHRERECVHVTHWRKWAQARAVGFVDAFPAFLDAGEPEAVVRGHFIPGDVHWNEAGHRVMARVIGDALARELRLP